MFNENEAYEVWEWHKEVLYQVITFMELPWRNEILIDTSMKSNIGE